MRIDRRHLFAALLLVTGSLVGLGPVTPASASGPQPGPLQAHVATNQGLRRAARQHGKLATELRGAASLAPGAGFQTYAELRHDLGGRVDVLVTGTADIAAAVQDHGGAVKAVVPSGSAFLADAAMPAGRLAELSDDARVEFVSSARQYVPHAGTVQSEGVTETGADTWQGSAQSGVGVNVAVLDPGGFQGYSSELGDELPASVVTRNYCGSDPNTVDSSFLGDAHGTETAAIVHDMAPGAALTLICVSDDAQLLQVQAYILGLNSDADPTNDIRVINTSWGDPIADRGDGLGNGPFQTIDAVARTLRMANVLWVASAGNEAEVHDSFTPAGPDYLPLPDDPNGPHVVAWAPGNYEDGMAVGPFETVDIRVKWDSWVGPPQDFDLYAFDTSGNLIGSSVQDQTAGAPPIEFMQLTNPFGTQQVIYLVLDRFNATANPRFDTYALGGPSELVVAAGSISAPASSPYVVAVGAACWADESIEPYSSQGPTIDGRVKPDLTGPDGTSGQVTASTTPYGPANSSCTSGFTGTSAAAPHVTGAAALVLGHNPLLDVAEVQEVLESRATDLAAPGFDDTSGWGFLTMGAVDPAPAGPTGDLYLGISPWRAFDTRPGLPPVSNGDSPLGAQQTVAVTVAGTGLPVPADASAVALDLTVTQGNASSFLTLFPAGQARPLVASLVFSPGQTVTIHATVRVGDAGQISLYNHNGSAHVGIDVVGYYTGALASGGGGLMAFSPVRTYDTRPGGDALPVSHGDQPLGAGETITAPFAGQTFTPPGGGASVSVPLTATAVVLNVTALTPTSAGFLTVYPDDVSRPTTADLNFPPGSVVSNLIVAKLGAGGGVKIFNFTGSTHLAIELMGYFDPTGGARFVPLRSPTRQLDTRFGNSRLGGLANGASTEVQERLLLGVPHDALAVLGTMTVVFPGGSGYVTAFPGGAAAPFSANIAYGPLQLVGNATITAIATDGRLAIANHTSAGVTDVAYDLAGYFVP